MKKRYSYLEFLPTCLLLLSLSAATTLSWLYCLQPFLTEVWHQVHPVGIPWLQDPLACEETGRVWQENTCWDSEHDPNY